MHISLKSIFKWLLRLLPVIAELLDDPEDEEKQSRPT